MPVHNKLVRDKIPEMIEKAGKQYRIRTLNDHEYIIELKKKLGEEVEEYLNAKDDAEAVEELADVLELIHALVKIHNSNIDQVETIRIDKANKRGGFQDKVFLIDVDDE